VLFRSEEKELSRQYQQWFKAKTLCEDFSKAEIKIKEEIVNSKFKTTKWKLFEKLTGKDYDGKDKYKEVCEAMHNGVAYSTNLNKAQTVNTGIDIINTLSGFYGIQLPIFVDNAEGVSIFEPTEAQLIKLIKPPMYDNLDKEVREVLNTRWLSEKNAREWYEKNIKSLRVEVEE
jgi:hypothetical protein